uniref:Queuosine 5'-phosphate N-glycosylase/hydrolase n=1 Tax=Blastobotrys adeninivorans TaxID=409370 RepID=A0A060SZL4_BLAAD
MSRVRKSAEVVSQLSKNVTVDANGCENAARKVYDAMKANNYSTTTWSSHALNPDPCKQSARSIVDWIATVDLLNFSFWSDVDEKDSGTRGSGRYSVEYNGTHYTGYWSLVAAINRALDRGIAITSPTFWDTDEFNVQFALNEVFYSSTDEHIPLLEERIAVLKEASSVLKSMGYASFAELIPLAQQSATRLVELLSDKFPSFNDTSMYHGHKVYIFKRVQIFVADLWACFRGQGYGQFTDIDEITMFADYRVPQILHSLGCLKYSPQLQTRLLEHHLIPHGDPDEVELRACSIWAVELMLKQILTIDPGATVNAILIDFYLWDTAKQIQSKQGGQWAIPCHRTRSIYY